MGIITYYVVKRTFCFLDEWLFYILSIYLYIRELYFPLVICLIAGITMIYQQPSITIIKFILIHSLILNLMSFMRK